MNSHIRSYFIKRSLFLLITLLLLAIRLCGQQQKNYLVVYFKDKHNVLYTLEKPDEYLTSRAIERREKFNIPVDSTDLPVVSKYLELLLINNVAQKIYYTSRWMNLAVVEPHPDWESNINQSWIKKVEQYAITLIGQGKKKYVNDEIKPTFSPASDTITQPYLKQIGLDRLHFMELTGKGMRIAVLDAGFNYMQRHRMFDSLFNRNRIVATKDFVSFSDNVYAFSSHGMQVTALLAANEPGRYTGSAPGAEYILIVTDDIKSSTKIDEYNWLAGAEYADSLGADVISSSLGYAMFDNIDHNYTIFDLNGKTAISSIAAGMAASKGIAVIASAGNEGDSYSDWRYILCPSDNPDVIAAGSVDALGNKSSSSSIGTSNIVEYIKPDLMARGENVCVPSISPASGFEFGTGNGTSYSTPLIAGGIACLLQCFPTKSVNEIIMALKNSASNSFNPNRIVGWGIPDFYAAYRILKEIKPEFENSDITINYMIYHSVIKTLEINLTSNKDLNLAFDFYGTDGRLLYKQQRQVLKANREHVSINLNFTGKPQLVILSVRSKKDIFFTKKLLLR